MKTQVSTVLMLMNFIIFISLIVFSIYTFLNLENWGFLILWFLSLPLQMIMLGSLILYVYKAIVNKKTIKVFLESKASLYLFLINSGCIIVLIFIAISRP